MCYGTFNFMSFTSYKLDLLGTHAMYLYCIAGTDSSLEHSWDIIWTCCSVLRLCTPSKVAIFLIMVTIPLNFMQKILLCGMQQSTQFSYLFPKDRGPQRPVWWLPHIIVWNYATSLWAPKSLSTKNFSPPGCSTIRDKLDIKSARIYILVLTLVVREIWVIV